MGSLTFSGVSLVLQLISLSSSLVIWFQSQKEHFPPCLWSTQWHCGMLLSMVPQISSPFQPL